LDGVGDFFADGGGGGIDGLEEARGQRRVADDDFANGGDCGVGRFDPLKDLKIGGGQPRESAQLGDEGAQLVAGQPGVQSEAAFDDGKQFGNFERANEELVGGA